MQKVAFVDDNLDKYELAVIRKVAASESSCCRSYLKVKHIAAEDR
jgi:hypothetical protein